MSDRENEPEASEASQAKALHKRLWGSFLRDGHIAEAGSFEELMDKRGYFHVLYTIGQSEEDEG